MPAYPLKTRIASIISEVEKADIETCITSRFSWLFLSSDRVFKVRQDQPTAVTSLSRGAVQALAEIEFERGKMFSPDLYQGLINIETNNQAYCVLILKRMQDNKLLRNIYQKQVFDSRSYLTLIKGLNLLHERSGLVTSCDIRTYVELTWEFLDRTSRSVKTPLDKRFSIKEALVNLKTFFDKHIHLFQERVEAGFFLDTHGDLHSANIFLTEEAVFIDPAVASPHMYHIDYLQQLADIMLDLLACGHNTFIPRIMKDVTLVRFDADANLLLSKFYLPLRALLRVALWRLYRSSGLASPLPVTIHNYCALAGGFTTLR